MQKNVRVKLYDIVIFLLYFSVVKVYAVPQVIQQILKIISMGIVASYFLSHSTKSFFNKTIILPCLMLISSVVYFIGGSSNIKILLDGILNASCYCLISVCVLHYEKKYAGSSGGDVLLFNTDLLRYFYNFCVCESEICE